MRNRALTAPRALRRELVRLGAPRAAVALASITPMLAEPRGRPFSAAGWMFEMKYDGYRLLAGTAAAGEAHLAYRSGRDATALFPGLARAVAALPFASLVLDGEVVALDPAGRPSFGLLQRWLQPLAHGLAPAGAADAAPPVLRYFVFDLLAAEGHDVRPLPLAMRRALLQPVMAAADPQGPLRCAEVVEQRGEDLFAAVAALGLEGIVAKRAASPYRAGRSADWLKIRSEQVGDFAIVGYGLAAPPRPSSLPARLPDLRRLHLAVRYEAGFRYVGSVGSGLPNRVRDELQARLATARPAPVGAPRGDRRSVWIAPWLVCEVRYKEWTTGGNLRQPVFLRLRDDKHPDECVAPAATAGEG